jgi:hypothetical protein
MAEASDQSYRVRLGQVLRGRDPNALHLFLRQQAAGYGDEAQVEDLEQRSHPEMVELMHRMILTRPDLADLHAESRAWLAAHGADAPPAGPAGPQLRPGRGRGPGGAGGARGGRRRGGRSGPPPA